MSDPLAASLDKLLAQRDAAAAAENRIREEEEHKEIAIVYTRLSALKENKDVSWFINTYLVPLMRVEAERALNPATAGEQGPLAANRYELAATMVGMLSLRHREAGAAVEAMLGKVTLSNTQHPKP